MKNNTLLILLFLSILLFSCGTTKYIEVPVEVEKIKTEYKETIKYDSVYIKDSVDRYVKGDTVFIYKEKTKFEYKYKYDTVVINDSVQYPVYITNEVEVNKLKNWQIVLMCLGIGFVCFLVFKLLKIFKIC